MTEFLFLFPSFIKKDERIYANKELNIHLIEKMNIMAISLMILWNSRGLNLIS